MCSMQMFQKDSSCFLCWLCWICSQIKIFFFFFCRLLEILSHCLAALRQFSPDLCEILLDQVNSVCLAWMSLVTETFSTARHLQYLTRVKCFFDRRRIWRFSLQSMDVCEFEPVLMIGFSTPAVDQDSPPTFGAMVSCISLCIRLLSKVTVSFMRNTMCWSWKCLFTLVATQKLPLWWGIMKALLNCRLTPNLHRL